jgi:EmrB/QacA subfamily drug resistance transporter
MCIAQGMILLDNTIVNVALPSIQRELGVTPSNLEWIINAYVLALASLILPGGTLGDRFGRKRFFLIGLAIFTVFSAACALSRDDPQLIVFRALQGVGAAAMAPLTLSILVDAFPPERRTTAIGIWAGVSGLGFGAGPILGGLLIELFDWSAIFWVNIPLGVACFLLTVAAVQESRNPGARRLDPMGTLLASGGLFLVTFALIETNTHPWGSGYTLSLLGAGVAALVCFVLHERRVEHPMVPLGLFRSPQFSSANVVYALAYLALAGMFFFVTLYFQNVKGWSALQTGLSWIPLNLPFLLVSPFAGRFVRRFGTSWVSGGGILLGAVGTIGLAQLDVGSSYHAAWPCYLLIGFGYGFAVPAVSSAAMGAVPAAQSGVGSGILNSSRQVGAAVGLAVLGSISHAIVSRSWQLHIEALPAGVRAQAASLFPSVAGGEGRAIGALIGPEAASMAFESFVSGLHVALWVAGAAMVLGAAIAFVGLRGPRAAASAPVTGDPG